MIEIVNLSKHFNDKVAVDKLNLTIDQGEIFGFLGPNGAGKTTTVKMLTGMLIPSFGTAKIAGFDVTEQAIEVKKRVGYVPESGALFESLSAWEYLELVTDLHGLDRTAAHRRMEEFLTLFGLMEEKDQQLASFSKGMKQKVLVAAAFLHNPQVLFLDEPLGGLDANAAMVMKQLLKKFAAQSKTIIFCSHILEVVERICTRVAIIHRGKLVTQGTASEITQEASQTSFEAAFGRLTDARIEGHTQEILQALEDH